MLNFDLSAEWYRFFIFSKMSSESAYKELQNILLLFFKLLNLTDALLFPSNFPLREYLAYVFNWILFTFLNSIFFYDSI